MRGDFSGKDGKAQIVALGGVLCIFSLCWKSTVCYLAQACVAEKFRECQQKSQTERLFLPLPACLAEGCASLRLMLLPVGTPYAVSQAPPIMRNVP